jgi:hypothetical protein
MAILTWFWYLIKREPPKGFIMKGAKEVWMELKEVELVRQEDTVHFEKKGSVVVYCSQIRGVSHFFSFFLLFFFLAFLLPFSFFISFFLLSLSLSLLNHVLVLGKHNTDI